MLYVTIYDVLLYRGSTISKTRCYSKSKPKYSSLFVSTLPSLDTTRPPRSGEVNHRDYHFVTREEMERGIQSGRFLEYGETKGHLYGMSVSSVRSVIDNGRVPVLDLHPQVCIKYCRIACSRQFYM